MPIVRVIDFETTGMEPPAEVIEVGWCDIQNEGAGWVVQTPWSQMCGVKSIPPEVRAVHHIRLEDVAGSPSFTTDDIWMRAEIHKVDIVAAHNLEFEAKFYGTAKLPVLCTYKAALRVWPHAPSHSNGALHYWLEDQGVIPRLDEAFSMPPHRAAPDAYVTAHILIALLEEATAKQMVAWTKEPRLLPTCPLGKFRGKPWPEVESGFLNWMLQQPTMEDDLKWNARRELDRRAA